MLRVNPLHSQNENARPSIGSNESAMTKNSLSIAETRDLLSAGLNALIANRELLNELDQAIGDGDHGSTIARGSAAGLAALDKSQPLSVNALFGTIGSEMINSMGGASGMLFGLFFRGAEAAPSVTTLDSASIGAIAEQGLARLQGKTKAIPGDKTMIDALAPAVEALKEAVDQPLAETLDRAADAAERGAASTEGLLPKFGRARTLGERARNARDAGATSIALLFRAMAKHLAAR
jgi:dihydroxyacetone kinase-like protein